LEFDFGSMTSVHAIRRKPYRHDRGPLWRRALSTQTWAVGAISLCANDRYAIAIVPGDLSGAEKS
jgi:hypothetical protein